MRTFLKGLFLFLVGGGVYCVIELLFRGHTHYTMMIVGGICFLMCGALNEHVGWDMPFLLQMLLGCLIITGVELISGLILNVWLGLDIWNYANLPLNLWGQICVLFMAAWFLLSAVAIVLDDYLRYWIFGEEKPHYTIWRMKCSR